MAYQLPKGYRRQKPRDFDDTLVVVSGPGSWVWQPEVYPFAAEVAREAGVTRIIDVGCGSADKLAPLAEEFECVGVDRGAIVAKITHSIELWAADLESGDNLPVYPRGALLICSDVIEHLVYPEQLLLTLRHALEDGAAGLVLSTPDRILARGPRHRGPCPNPFHAQEWSLDELVALLQENDLTVASASHTRSNDHEPEEATSLVVVVP